MKGHVAFVAVAEVGDRVLGPLIGLGQQHAVLETLVDVVRAVSLERRCVSGRFSQLVPSRS